MPRRTRPPLLARLPLAAALLGLGAAAVGCSDSPADSSASVPPPGAIWTKPSVELPSRAPTSLVVTDLIKGSGPAATLGDSVVVHYVGVQISNGVEFDNSYDRDSPFFITLGDNMVIQGWEDGLIGVQQGGRRQLDVPSDLAYGESGAGGVIGPNEALSFVIDVLAVLPTFTPQDAPDVTVEPHDNVDAVSSVDLVAGDGVTLEEGAMAVIHMVIYRADTGERLNATWGDTPLHFLVGEGSEAFPGIVDAVKGMKVGGRRQSQIPFSQVFGGQGSATLGLPEGVDIVLVMDLITAY
ncbi:MAG: FKBP-type peptidyl-prolyl cis-trans isomerase [Ilumatobacteraceae bacterium]